MEAQQYKKNAVEIIALADGMTEVQWSRIQHLINNCLSEKKATEDAVMANEYKSRVYTDRPAYADFDAPAKFQAIQSIVAKHLKQHPNAICSYSGGADSDILIDVIERTREIFGLPPVKYVFFNTGLEMKATKDHVKATAEKYGVEIETVRPKVNIVAASRRYGIPFVSKIMSAGLSGWQKKGVPLAVADEYEQQQLSEASVPGGCRCRSG